jgi:DNA processing protein
MLPKDDEEILFLMALTVMPGIGCNTARVLLEHFKTAKDLFKAPLKEIKHIAGVNDERAKIFRDKEILKHAEAELAFVNKHGIALLWYDDAQFPGRLKQCSDAPFLLFYKGVADLNSTKIVAVVGTRRHSEYGTRMCGDLIEGLQNQEGMLIVSGLAEGIDTVAHKKSLELGMPTVGVLAHGLERIFPASNKKLANEMAHKGGVLTEFPHGTIPDKGMFPRRNRIVAGISDVTVVVESDAKGGAMITARLASGYNREVAAIPGRATDGKSSGCNELIRTNIAALINGADDLLELMNWHKGKKRKAVQKQLFIQLSQEEQTIVDVLQTKDSVHADELYHKTGLANSQLAATLLQLEMQGIIKALPGKNYRMN